MNMQHQETISGSLFFAPVTLQRSVIPVTGQLLVVVHGERDTADDILRHPKAWANDAAIATFVSLRTQGKAPDVEQMKALAISLKKHTSDWHQTVGGADQIAVLMDGRVSVEQPKFPPLAATGFKFQIVETFSFEDSELKPFGRTGDAVAVYSSPFSLYFKNSFKRVQQHLGGAYWGANVFRECRLMYSGGRLQFENSNQVYDSDLVLTGVKRDSPQVQHLLNDFKWRHIEGLSAVSAEK